MNYIVLDAAVFNYYRLKKNYTFAQKNCYLDCCV
mgnify:FL=1